VLGYLLGLIGVDRLMKGILMSDEKNVLNDERIASANSVQFFEACFGASPF
jgi:hypothetical protein